MKTEKAKGVFTLSFTLFNSSPWLAQQLSRTKVRAQLWGLALGADIAMLNGSRLDCLHMGYQPLYEQERLRTSWNVRDAASLRATLEWLLESGHNDVFVRLVSSLNEQLFDLDDSTRGRRDFLLQNWDKAAASGHILAFDLARVSNLSRFGYSACYISSAEAWEWIHRAALRAQPLFSSWAEFASNMRFGFEFWDAAEPCNEDFFKQREFLLKSPKSPWVVLPWNTSLAC